jgi:membrane-associated phospholipid phosphatase
MSNVSNRRLVATAVLAVAGIALFVGVTHDVTAHEGVARADPRILHDVLAYRSSVLTPMAKIVTTFGTSPLAYAAVVVSGVTAVRSRRRAAPLVLGAVVLLSGQLVRLAINHGVARARPPEHLRLVHAAGYAFPSGHTTTATLAYVIAAVLLTRSWPSHRVAIFALAAIVSVAVGLSRIYLGVHWPTDVLGGWLLAGSWLALWALARQLAARR